MIELEKLILLRNLKDRKQYSKYTETGNLVSFETNVSKKLKGLSIPFIDENGLTELTVYHCGKNLFDASHMTTLNGYMGGSSGAYKVTSSQSARMFVIPCVGGATYTITRKNAGSRFGAGTSDTLHDSGGFSLIDYASYSMEGYSTKELHITTSASARYLYIWYYRSQSDSDYDETLEEMMVVHGATAGTYATYNGLSKRVAFPNDIGTVTAGELNAVTGILTVTAPESKTVQLDPVQISTFVGVNTLWSDANGDLAVTYLKKEA